jgi:hypothetical protein
MASGSSLLRTSTPEVGRESAAPRRALEKPRVVNEEGLAKVLSLVGYSTNEWGINVLWHRGAGHDALPTMATLRQAWLRPSPHSSWRSWSITLLHFRPSSIALLWHMYNLRLVAPSPAHVQPAPCCCVSLCDARRRGRTSSLPGTCGKTKISETVGSSWTSICKAGSFCEHYTNESRYAKDEDANRLSIYYE